ncbi:MAG TPA: FAD binding domain-containing protein [Thermoplasmata archaeon]|nr:FAD binding domain-containing protein [Thermoplasmata archaeon]
MHLDPFELYRPTTVDEVVRLAGDLGSGYDLLAGGTDLLPNYKMHLNVRPNLISLDGVEELKGHSVGRIGAMARLADLESDGAMGAAYPGLGEAIREVATPLVRAQATVGGNLLVETRCFFFNQSYFWRESLGFCLKADGDRCHVVPQKERCYATFSGDLAPALAVLDAEVEIAGSEGRRRVPVLDLYDRGGDGIRRHHLRPGELLVAARLPESARGRAASYQKLRVRPSFDFPELGLAASAEVDDGTVRSLVLAAGGLETCPRRFDEVTARLVGSRLTDEAISRVSQEIMNEVRPVHNTFLMPTYRKRMVGVFVRRALERFARPPRRTAS